MSTNVLQVRIQQGYDTEDGWAESDPVLLEGEFAINSDTFDYKVGDGVSTWSELPYASGQLTFAASQIYDLESAISAMDLIVETANYLGTSTVGSENRWMYLEGGAPVACSSTIGSETQPVYINSGVVTALPSTVGSSTQPIYLSDGSFTASTASVGSSNSPIYIDSGTLKECSTINATTVSVSDISPTSETTYFITSTVEPGNVSLLSNDGLKFAALTGTASALGYNRINLGTNIASGTAKNAYGILRIYGTGSTYWDITGNKSSSDNYTLMLPASDGCLITATDGVAIGGVSVPVYVKADGSVAECTSISLNAATATKLASSVTIRTNLASTSTASFDGSASITPGVTGTLAVGNGGTGNTTGTATYATTAEDVANTLYPVGVTSAATTTLKRNTSITMVGDTITANSFVGTLSGSATSLTTSRTLQTNLASTASASFNGTANASIGVTGTLGISNGGTGTTTGHIAITQNTDTTQPVSPAFGDTFSVVDAITRDDYGHITKINTTTITLPTVESASDTKVTQTLTSTSASYPVLLAPSGQTATTTTTAYFGTGLQFNPSTNTLTATTFSGALSGNASTATTATKLGSSTVGSGTQPIYLSSGTATASTSNVGSGTKPMYLSSGVLTASSSSVGSGTQLMYLSSGTLTASSSSVGSTSSPVYLSSGVITECGSVLAATIAVTTTNPTSATTYYPLFGSLSTSSTVRANNGLRYLSLEGTTSTDGYGEIQLGNGTATGTEANKFGRIRIYGTGTSCWYISGSKSLTTSTTLYLPNSGGCLVCATNGSAVGDASTPVYVDSNGVIQECTSISSGSSSLTVSSSSNNIYLTGVTSTSTTSASTIYRSSSSTVYISGSTLCATTFSGSLSGTATNATNVYTNYSSTAYNPAYILFESAQSTDSGYAAVRHNTNFLYSQTVGTSSTGQGSSIITLGNSSAAGEDGASYGAIRIYGYNGYYWQVTGQNSTSISRTTYLCLPAITSDGWCVGTNGYSTIGSSTGVYVSSSGVATALGSSDGRRKNVTEIDSRYIDLFMELNPVAFTWKESSMEYTEDMGERIHLGLIAQQVKEAMDAVGLSDNELCAYIYDEEKDEYHLAYQQLDTLTMLMVQKHEKTLEELQAQVEELQSQIKQLQASA